MKYFFSAGEASGDIHAADVMRQIRFADPGAQFAFLGGDAMAKASGRQPIVHYRDMAFMGFIAVVRHLGKVLGNLKKAKKALAAEKPDVLVLVDYPDFNIKLAKHAKKLGIPVCYYIAPKLWAWKAYRLKALKKYVDEIYSILPFEEEWFGSHGLKVKYVGNPSVEQVQGSLSEFADPASFLRRQGLDPSRPVLALVPGSRVSEVKANLPVMDAVARRHPELQPVVAGAPGLDKALLRKYTAFPVVEGCTLRLMSVARVALVTSGTAALEAALAGAPQVVCYRAVGWRWAARLFQRVLKIPYASLPNLIVCDIGKDTRKRVNRETARTGVRMGIVPEMLVDKCTPDRVDAQLSRIIGDTAARGAQLRGYDALKKRLHTRRGAAETTASLIVNVARGNS